MFLMHNNLWSDKDGVVRKIPGSGDTQVDLFAEVNQAPVSDQGKDDTGTGIVDNLHIHKPDSSTVLRGEQLALFP